MAAALYICYQSIVEPLTHTQVVAYLEGLARAGYPIVLLTFEPKRLSREVSAYHRQRLAAVGIQWHWLRYHQQPTLPATAWDVLMGILFGFYLIRRCKVRLLHARAHVPGLMATVLKRLSGIKLLFDLRGFMAEEYADAGVWKRQGFLFRLTKRLERRMVAAADAVVVLSQKAETMLGEWYHPELGNKPVYVIPCCVDLGRIPEPRFPKPGVKDSDGATTIVYVGKLGGWYLTDEMAAFIATARRLIPNLRWHVWTQSDSSSLRRRLAEHGLNGEVSIGRLAPAAVPGELTKAHAGLSFVKPCLSKLASSPTKIAEYLAAGLPVVATTGVGDTESLLRVGPGGSPVGVLVRELSAKGYCEAICELQILLDDPQTPMRCRRVAEQQFDLERVGWSRYRQLYEHLLRKPDNARY